MATNPLDLLRMRKMALAGANRRPAAAAFLDMAGQTGQSPQAPMPSIAEGARLRALKALGASQQPTASITKPRLLTPTTAASGAGSMLPGRGTPGSAALGAFGSTMSQLGGWQDKPMTFGQILGASLGKAREAYGTAEERQRQIAADKAAAERQAEQDALARRNIESQIASREIKPVKAMPFKPQAVTDPATNQRGKADVTYLPVGDARIEQLGGNPKTGRVVLWDTFVPDAPKEKAGLEMANGVIRSSDGSIIGQAILNPDPDAPNRFIVRTNTGEERPMAEGESFLSDEQFKKVVIKENDMGKLADQVNTAERGIRLLKKYEKQQGGTRSGYDRIADQVMGGFNTFLKKGLTQEQLNLVLSEGTLQSLVGNYRIEVVGGGVMTEQDAIRVIKAVGGNVNALQDPARVKAAIQDLLFEKMNTYNNTVKRYNAQVTLSYGDIYEPKPLFTEEDLGLVSSVRPDPATPDVSSASPNAAAVNNALGMY